MPFEIVETAHLPPHVCIVCGCAAPGPYVFVPQNRQWEYNWPFICKACVEEMATALGIAGKEVEQVEVEVPRAPTAEEILAVIRERFTITSDSTTEGGNVTLSPKGLASQEPFELCACGAKFTGPTAKAKLGSHMRTCKVAKMADERGGDAPGKAVGVDAG